MIVNVDGIYFGETKKARQEREERLGTEPSYLPDENFRDYTDVDIPPDFDDAQLPF